MYYDVYRARGNDVFEMTTLAKQYGYGNPGPIVMFPPNRAAFPANASPGAVRPATQILVPWHPNVLRKLLATQRYLGGELAKTTEKLMEEEDESGKELEEVLVLVDNLSLLLNIGRSIGYGIAEGAKGEMTMAQAMVWFADFHVVDKLVPIAALAIPAPSEPKRDFKYVIRHTLGPWTPSFWASVYAACKTGDLGVYLYGPAAIASQTKLKIKWEVDSELTRLVMKIQATQQQMVMPFYAARI